MMDWAPIFLTLKLAAVTTVLLAGLGIPLGYWLSYSRGRAAVLVEPLVSLPLVLPPTVLGFYLLLLFSPNAPLGSFLENIFDVRVVFTFTGIVIGSVIFSLPFMVNPVKSGFQSVPTAVIESAYTLGKNRWETFWKVLVPLNIPGILTGAMMSFAHTLGEFGVVLMVGGNIPKSTRVASIAIYSEVESLNYPGAHLYAAVLIVIAFVILFTVKIVNRHRITSLPA